jgi:2-polyprenyl-3-methyl-5-hydroxy-6-metoxy-1,4-benzoquinol methylase
MMWDPRCVLSSAFVYELLQTLFGYRRRFVREFVRPESRARILDIGCGPARILDYLPADVDYVGFDMNTRYIAAAQARYGHRAQFHCALVGEQAVTSVPFDIVLAVGVVHHLNDAAAELVFSSARAQLTPQGTLVTLDPAFAQGQSRARRWFAAHDRGQHVRAVHEYEHWASRSFGRVDTAVVTDLYSVPYTICIMRCSSNTG